MVYQFDQRFDVSATSKDATPMDGGLDALAAEPRAKTVDAGTRPNATDGSVSPEDLISRALEVVAARLRDWPGLTAVPDPHPQFSSGGAVVRLHLQWRGVPIFEACLTVRFSADGLPRDICGHLHSELRQAAMRQGGTLDLRPSLTAGQAATLATLHVLADVEHDLTGREARTITSFATPSRPTVLHKHGLRRESSAHLVIFCLNSARHLAWHVVLDDHLSSQDADLVSREFAVLVRANGPDAGTLLYCRELGDRMVRALVFEHHPDEGTRQLRPLPGPVEDLPTVTSSSQLPDDFPPPWVSGRRTLGNNTKVAEGNGGAVKGRRVDGEVHFVPDDPLGTQQQVINAFYFCNRLHDLFYPLGFDESGQNFQRRNFIHLEGDRDALEVRVFDTILDRGASMRSREDGHPPRMILGRVGDLPHDRGAAPDGRHTALDADIVFHEFVHGVSNRLVGGRLHWDPLSHPQSHALAEGLSDFFALSLQNHERADDAERTTFAPWIAGGSQGLRRDPYDENFPATFGDLGSADYSEPHDAGEIWCACLMSWQRALATALADRRRAHRLCWTLLVDALKHFPVGSHHPTFLDARDALFIALDQLPSGDLLSDDERDSAREVWRRVAARYGMGPAALSPDASFQGVLPDFTAPV